MRYFRSMRASQIDVMPVIFFTLSEGCCKDISRNRSCLSAFFRIESGKDWKSLSATCESRTFMYIFVNTKLPDLRKKTPCIFFSLIRSLRPALLSPTTHRCQPKEQELVFCRPARAQREKIRPVLSQA